MRPLALFAAVLVCAASGCAEKQLSPAGPYPQAPIIILGLDTVRGDHLHVAGKSDIQTPHLDALAADGVFFAKCQSTAPWTAPAFASLLTGVTPYRHGYLGGRFLRLGAQQVTLAEHLQAADYATGAFVSIDWLNTDFGMAQGFDDHHFLRPRKRKNGYLVTRRGLEYVGKHQGEPFLLFMHYFDAHAPYTPPAPFDRMYYKGVAHAPGDRLLDFLKSDANKVLDQANRERMYEWLEGVTDPEYPIKQYAAGVSYVDHEVGLVVAGLKTAGLYDRALIIAIGDHGEHLGEHDLYFTHALPWQEAVHVPLIIKWPESRYAGRVVQRRVSILDVLPTVFGVRGVAKPNDLDGRDLTEVLTDPDAAPPSLLISETGSSAEACWKTLVVDDWKLFVHWSGAGRRTELYDLKRDPLELKNVADARPDVVAQLLAELGRHVDLDAPLTTQEPVGDEHLSDAVRHKLRSLGYVH